MTDTVKVVIDSASKGDIIMVMPPTDEPFSMEDIYRMSEMFEGLYKETDVNFLIMNTRLFKLDQNVVNHLQKMVDNGVTHVNMGEAYADMERENQVQEHTIELPERE